MLKRISSLFLAVVMIITMLPPLALPVNAAGPGAVIYERQILERPVMTALMAQNNALLEDPNTKLGSLNYGWKFISGVDGLNTLTYTRYTATHTYSFANGLNKITDIKNRNQLWVGYTLSMCPDRHSKFFSHPFTEKLCYQYTALYDDYNFYFRYSGGDNAQNVLKNYGTSTSFKKVSSNSSKLDIAFGLGGSCTAHGDAYTTDASVYFADLQAPKISSISVTADQAGNTAKQYFKGGDSVYIQLQYDEPIRFSDNSVNHDNVTLKLNLARKASASDAGVETQQATLVALNDTRLTFRYNVPDTLYNTSTGVNEDTDHYIVSIKGSSDQSSFYGSNTAFDLKYNYGPNGYTALPSKYQSDPNFVKTNCLITDLAGNPAQTFTNKAFNSYTYLDNVKPEIGYVSVEGNMIDKNYTGNLDVPDLDRSTVFAGVGDTMTFTAWFSEYMTISPAAYTKIIASINIQDGGNPVKLKAVTSGNTKRNVEDKFDSAYITFETMTITPGMTPIEYAGVEDKRISIASISLLEGLTLTDPSNNTYSTAGVNIIKDLNITANKTEFLDNLSPSATTTATPSGNKYYPVFYSGSDRAKFYFPITPYDNTNAGSAYVSGINTNEKSGSFEWQSTIPFTFKYKVSGNADRPSDPIDGWSTGYTNTRYSFTQITAGSFIHIALIDTINYNVKDTTFVVYPTDFAGNVGLSTFDLDYIYDSTGPIITQVSYKTGVSTEDNRGYISTTIKLEDLSKVDIATVFYRWYDNITKTYVTDWVPYFGAVNESATSMALDFSLTGLSKGAKHDYNLLIKANDHSNVVVGGNQTSSNPFNYQIDLSYPAYNFSYATGYETEPYLKIENLQKHPDTNANSTVVVMIKDPLGTGSEYFVRTITTGSYDNYFLNHMADGDVLDHFVFADVNYQPGGIFGSAQPFSEPNLWRYHTVTTDNTLGDILYRFNDDAPNLDVLMRSANPIDRLTAQRLQAMMGGKYYGDIEVTVISGYGTIVLPNYTLGVDLPVDHPVYQKFLTAYPTVTNVESYAAGSNNFTGLDCYTVTYLEADGKYYLKFHALDQDGNIMNTGTMVTNTFRPWVYCNYISSIPSTANVDVKSYTLKAAASEYVLTGSGYQDINASYWSSTSHSVHNPTLTPTLSDLGIASPWSNPSEGNKFRTSLDEEEFTVTIENKIIPLWKKADVNFENADTYIGLFLIASPDAGAPVSSDTPLWRIKLADIESQTFRIPADKAIYTGHYQVKVQLSSKGSGKLDSTVVDCYLDKTVPIDFGPKSASHSFDYTSASGVMSVSMDYSYSLNTPLIYMGTQIGKEVTLSLGAEVGPLTVGGINYRQLFLKAWNASAETIEGIAPDNTRWYDISSAGFAKEYNISFFDSADDVKTTVLGDVANAGLGLIRGAENVIHYQITGANGETSAVRTLVIEVSGETPTIEMELTPGTSASNIQSAIAFIKKLESDTMTEMTVRTVGMSPQVVDSTGYRITNNETHAFYTTNAYGNFAFDDVTAPFVDSVDPSTSKFSFTGDMNGKNNLGVVFFDNMPADPSETKLYVKFEDAYMARLQAVSGFEVNSDGYMQITLPRIADGKEYAIGSCGDKTAMGGIYKVFVVKNTSYGADGYAFDIWVYMDYLYDSEKGTEFTMVADYYVEDQAGNRSSVENGTISVLNKKPAIIGASNGGNLNNNLMDIDLTFDKPVQVLSPDHQTHTNHSLYGLILHENPTGEFAFKREAFPIFGEGDYTISFIDVFGVEYHQTYTSSFDFSKFGLAVEYSTTALTKEDVTVTITAQTAGTKFRLADFPANSVLSDPRNDYVVSSSITLSENGYVLIRMVNLEINEIRWAIIPVTNILNHAPNAVETWYYSEFSSNTLPQGVTESTYKVTAFINSTIPNRSIEGADGCSLSYTFPFGTRAGDSYTFTYTDAVGNIGTKTVYCPVSIVRPSLPTEDKEAPNFIVKVFGKYGGVYKHAESWYSPNTTTPRDADGNPLPSVTTPVTNTGIASDGSIITYLTFKDLLDNMSWTGGYKLVFEVFDSSPTKLVLLNPGDSAANLTYANAASYGAVIDGVIVSGNTVTITNKDAEFKIAVVDDGNAHQLTGTTYQSTPYSSLKEMNFGGSDHWLIDLTPPTAETALEFKNFYTVTAFFRLNDTQSNPTLISPLWQTLTDTTSPFYVKYKDWYYKEFTGNTILDIDYRDTAYNLSRTTLQVGGLNNSNPKVTLKWWTPSAYSVSASTGAVTKYGDQPPNHKTNSTVRAGISFDRDITSMKLWWWNGTAYTDDSATVTPYATLEQQVDFAVISFFQDAAVKLTFEAQNTKTGEIELTLANVIDKTPPTVTIVDTRNDTATSTQATFVFSISEDVTDLAGKPYYQANGQFEKEISARGTYKYTFSDGAGNITAVTGTVSNIDDAPPVVIFNDMPDKNTSVSGSYTFKAAMSEAGTITMLGQTATVSAPTNYINGKPDIETITWHDFTVTQNGSYLVTGTDAAGRRSPYYVSINCIDNIAPTISMTPSILRVRQETDVASLTDQVLRSGVTITDNVSTDLELIVDITGKPSQTDMDTVGVYPITITATDQAGNTRAVQRFIRVYAKSEPEVLVNGKKTDNLGTTVIIGTYDLQISVNIPDFNGEPYTIYIKQGDKTAGQMKRDAMVVKGGTYTVTQDGYYTLYIVRQNREAYLTKLYIEK